MVHFLSLSSGSNGNCYYIGNGDRGILIDVGIGGRTVKKRLLQNGIGIESIMMVLVSHDHFDHIRSLEAGICHCRSAAGAGAPLLHLRIYEGMHARAETR